MTETSTDHPLDSSGAETADLAEFRATVRQFFETTLPAVLEGRTGSVARGKAYRAALYDAGLAGLDYPAEFGGRGLGPAHQSIWAAESEGRVPTENSVFGIGVGMALPVVRDHGSDAVRRRFLRPGLRGDEIWCQLYSEPGAGSDLASLSTRAVRDGDEWVVSGQKVWTSGAQNADLSILLARTDPDAPKHRGITMLVMPMDQPGVTVRPLRQMTGHSEFNEVFIDEARVPADWVIGEVNDGWRMAVALLAHERVQTGVASMDNSGMDRLWSRVPIPVVQLIDLARQRDRLDDPVVRQELAQLWINERVVGFLRGRTGLSPSIGKLWRTVQGRAATDLAARICFPSSPAWEPGDDDAEFFAYQTLNCRGMSLGGGTDEIQRNTLGERVLGLPREPTVDKDTPFRELLKGTQRSSGEIR